jgi:hypothetical protein
MRQQPAKDLLKGAVQRRKEKGSAGEAFSDCEDDNPYEVMLFDCIIWLCSYAIALNEC